MLDLLRREVLDSNPVDLVAWGADPERFIADTRRLQPDVLIVEVDNLASDSLEILSLSLIHI